MDILLNVVDAIPPESVVTCASAKLPMGALRFWKFTSIFSIPTPLEFLTSAIILTVYVVSEFPATIIDGLVSNVKYSIVWTSVASWDKIWISLFADCNEFPSS